MAVVITSYGKMVVATDDTFDIQNTLDEVAEQINDIVYDSLDNVEEFQRFGFTVNSEAGLYVVTLSYESGLSRYTDTFEVEAINVDDAIDKARTSLSEKQAEYVDGETAFLDVVSINGPYTKVGE